MNWNISHLEKQINDLNLDIAFTSGIEEKLEELMEDDIYSRYGAMVARGEMLFNREILENYTELVKAITKTKVSKTVNKRIDW